MFTFPTTLFGKAPLAATFINSYNLGGGTSPSVSASIGTAAADRYVFILVSGYRNANNQGAVTSVTIGGNTATLHANIGGGSIAATLAACVAGLLVPSGTSATVVVNFSDSFTDSGIGVIAVTGLNSTTPFDSDAVLAGTGGIVGSISANIDVPGNGLMLAVEADIGNGAHTWTNATEVYEGDVTVTYTGTLDVNLAAQSGRTVTCSSANSTRALALATFS